MIELYLDNYKVDMPSDFKINMTYQQIDLEKPEAKLNNYSKTVKVQGTNNNNNIFGHIFRFDTNIMNSDSLVGVSFDPNKRIPFVILNNGSLYESGYAQLDKIDIVNNIISYDLTLYGAMGKLFYNLKYNEDGTEKSLYDMYYGIKNINGTVLDKNKENNDVLFELDKSFVKKCWDIVIDKTADSTIYDSTSNTDIRKLICPIPCYQGYYDNFDNDVVLVNTLGIDNNSVVKKSIDSENKFYSPWSNWTKVKLEREVSNIEINDIRSHYLPYGIRLQAIYDALKKPENNGGFEFDDSNLNDIEKKYIYEGYIMQNPFEWDDVNANNINTTIKPNWSADRASLSNRIIYSEKIDVSNYVNPNAALYVMPRINFNWDIGTLHTQAQIYGGWYKLRTYLPGNIYLIKHATHYTGDSIQYFWAEGLDANGNVIQRSDVYMYGDKVYDDNENPYFLYNIVGQKEISGGIMMFSGYNSAEAGGSTDATKYFLDRNGLKLKESSLSYYDKTYNFPGYYINDDNLGVAINRSHLAAGYKENRGTSEFVGEEFKINIKLNKNVKSIRIVTDSIVTQVTANNADEGLTTVYWPYDNRTDRNTLQRTFTPGFCTFTNVTEEQINTGDATYQLFRRGANATWVDWDKISGMISGNTQIFDGAVETLDERHTVNKFTMFQNTESPYDYLISLAKMFNWKLELDPITNKVMIYSFNKYYNNEIVDINDRIDFTNISIIPTTSTSNNYNLSLELEESYCSKNWLKVNKIDYGTNSISTNYEFSEDPNNLLEDCVFKTAVPYIQRSVFYNEDNSFWPRPALGKYAEVSMWDWLDVNEEKSEKRFGRLHDTTNKISQNVQDAAPRLCFFDKEYSSVAMNNTLVFFNVENTVDNQGKTFQISDNIPITDQLNEKNCYIYLNANRKVVTDIDNNISGNPVMFEEFIPCFNTHFEYDNIEYWGTMKAEPKEPNIGFTYKNYTDIYNLCWKSYITDLYNKNNKVVTVKYRLTDTPRNAMKKFYTFDNAIWVINKIIDYNIDDYFTKVEFIQVQNKNNYLGIQ